MNIDVRDLDIHVISTPAMRLDELAQAEMLRRTVERMKPRLLSLDPLRELHVGDENDAAVIATILTPLRQLQDSVGTSVMVVHHMRKASEARGATTRPGQRLRGSSALHGASDSALYLEPAGTGKDKVVTVNAEHREAEEPDPFSFRLRVQTLSDGDHVWLEPTSQKEEESDEEQVTERTIAHREKARKKLLDLIRKASMPGRSPYRSKKSLAEAAKMSQKTSNPIVDELFAEKKFVVDESGAYRMPLELVP
jgi:hypothetical protein